MRRSAALHEIDSTSGEYDLLLKRYIPEVVDMGHCINENLLMLPDIERSLIMMTFKAF